MIPATNVIEFLYLKKYLRAYLSVFMIKQDINVSIVTGLI